MTRRSVDRYLAEDGFSRLFMGRLLATLFFIGGLVAILSPLLPPPPVSLIGVAITASAALVIAVVTWFLPWNRWPRRATLPFVAAAFPLIALYNHFIGAEPFRFAMYFILAFTWIGIAQPRGTALAFMPLYAIGYLAPLLTTGRASPESIASILIVGPVCLVVGESIAWVMEGLRSSQERLNRQLRQQALHDSLTNLPNRALFIDRLEHALALGARQPRSLAVLFVDLDDFKTINDSLGHDVGDQLLASVAQRLRGCLRSVDTVARMGGDEFAILLEGGSGAVSATIAADRVVEALAAPFFLNGRDVVVRASIGVARGDGGGLDAAEFLRHADMAMYSAKSDGKGGYRVFEQRMQTAARVRMDLRGDLRRAFDREEFILHYQPIVDLATGGIVGVEALVRWQRPGIGLVLPGDFLGLIEEIGLQATLGHWVVRTASQQVRAWQDQVPATHDLTFGVNLSPSQLRQSGLAETLAATLREYEIDPGRLTIEITESGLLDDMQATMRTLRELKRLGVALAIDDFGTGYSSLAYLGRFPIDILKIDRSFTAKLDGPAADAALAEAVIGLGHTIGLQVVAEGVERMEQLVRLRKLRCRLGQGYYLCPPLGGDQVTELLRAGRRIPSGRSGPHVPRPKTVARRAGTVLG